MAATTERRGSAVVRRRTLLPEIEECLDEGEREIARLDPGWAKAALFFRTGNRYGHPYGSMRTQSLIAVHRQLNVFRSRFEAGNTLALLHAVAMCSEENLPLPSWLAAGFQAQFGAFVRTGTAQTLDEAFQSPSMPTGTAKKAAAARQDWQLGALLWRDAWTLVQGDAAILSLDAAIEKLLAAKAYGVAKTKAKTLIKAVEDNQLPFLENGEALSRYLAKRRKRLTQPG